MTPTTGAGTGAEPGRRRPRPSRPRWVLRIAAVAGIVLAGLAVLNLMTGERPAAPNTAPAETPLALPTLPATSGREFFASPDGKPTNPGTREAPVDLATALSSNTPASPGDMIWLREGNYIGNFTSALAGTEAAPIHVRQFPGERATIAAAALDQPALTAGGSWTWYRDFEVTVSPAARSRPAAQIGDVRTGGGVLVKGANLALVNLVIHDVPKGIEVVQGAERVLLAGNLVYYAWWPDPPLGIGIRTAPGKADEYVAGNVVFGQGIGGISVGMTAGGRLLLEGNVSFNNGLQGDYYDRNLLVEGGTMSVTGNYTYYDSKRGGGENNFGYSSGCVKIEAKNNYFAHRAYPFTLSKCNGNLTGNVLIGPVDPAVVARHPGNTYLSTPPTGLRSFVSADPYDSDRVRIVVFNWDRHAAVNVDLSDAKMAPGTAYEVRDAQNYFGGIVTSGTYGGGRINIPTAALKIATPAGGTAIGAGIVHSAPEFLVFVLIKSRNQPPPAGPAGRDVPGSTSR